MHGREARFPFEMEKASAVYDPIELGEVQRAIDRLHAVREIFSDVSKNIDTSQRKQKIQYQRRKGLGQNTHIKDGAVVMRLNMIKRTKKGHKHEDTWMGPYKVLDISKYGCCRLQCITTGKDLKTKVKINQLKVYQEPQFTAKLLDQSTTALAVKGTFLNTYMHIIYSDHPQFAFLLPVKFNISQKNILSNLQTIHMRTHYKMRRLKHFQKDECSPC